MTAAARIAVATVTHQSAAELPEWARAVVGLAHRPLEVVVVDCASSDGSAGEARRALAAAGLPHEILPLDRNAGFAGGMNAALAATDAPFVLALNPDARPAPDYAGVLLARLSARPRAAAATGRLSRLARSPEPARLDACGMRLTWTWRHLDRGSGEVDHGQFARAERVFGATGAATLFRRQALDDVAVGGEVFDARFHSFREDAELAFRFAERGWEVLYEPAACALHRRSVVPGRRRALPAEVNYHSVKNRYLLRAYHQSALNLVLTLVPALARDLGALAFVVFAEHTSLAAYGWLWRHRREILARRRSIRARRTCPAWEVERWFFRAGRPL